MSTHLKVLDGTRLSGAPRLCDTCHTGVVRRGAADAKRQKIGFIRAKEWERLHEDEELLPPHLA